MYEKLLSIVRKMPFLSGDTPFAQLIRTYIVGGFNLVFGLFLAYVFQFIVLNTIDIPLRTYLTNIFGFSIGVIVSYFISRKIIFKLSIRRGNLKEFINFSITNLINLIVPLFIWYLIDRFKPSIQENELQFLAATVIIHGTILPLKYLIYKFFVFKDSLNNWILNLIKLYIVLGILEYMTETLGLISFTIAGTSKIFSPDLSILKSSSVSKRSWVDTTFCICSLQEDLLIPFIPCVSDIDVWNSIFNIKTKKFVANLRIIFLPSWDFLSLFDAVIAENLFSRVNESTRNFSEQFLIDSLSLEKKFSAITASKRISGSQDGRKIIRRIATNFFVLILKILFQTSMSDTHGMKGIRRSSCEKEIKNVVSTQDLFDTELLLRIERSGGNIYEVPAMVNEIRPSVSVIYSRIPRTIYSLIKLRFQLFKESLKTKNL